MVSGAYQLLPELRHGFARRPSRRPRVAALEWLAATASVAVRPLGSVLPARGPHRGRPVVLVHGYGMGRSCFSLLAARLAKAGVGPIATFDYWSLGPIERASRGLGRRIESLCAETGAELVDVVGHSLGGLVARHCLAFDSQRERAGRLITIGTPHGGTRNARLVVGSVARQLRTGSSVLQQVKRAQLASRVSPVAIWSRADGVIEPRAARWSQATEIVFDDLGHMSLLGSRRVARQVIKLLG